MTLSVRLAALIVCLLLVAGTRPGFAEEFLALVVSDESARGAESRRSPVFRKALVAVAQELLKRKVTPVGAEEVLPQGSFKPKGGNNLKIWQKASERAAPPVQFVVTLQLLVAVIERSQSQLVEVKLKSSAYTVPDKEELNTFETDKPRRYVTPNDCDRKCIVKIATDAVKEVAKEAGAANAKAIARAQ